LTKPPYWRVAENGRREFGGDEKAPGNPPSGG
jgi:hypothetical protein